MAEWLSGDVIANGIRIHYYRTGGKKLLHEALDGGGTVALKADPQGKTYSTALLRMEIDI
jgi:hypothetical protein